MPLPIPSIARPMPSTGLSEAPFAPLASAARRRAFAADAVPALAAERTQLVTPEALVWTTSGDALVMVILGGLGTLAGPVAGAALWVVLRDAISSYTPYWMLAMGVFFVAIVLFAAGKGK